MNAFTNFDARNKAQLMVARQKTSPQRSTVTPSKIEMRTATLGLIAPSGDQKDNLLGLPSFSGLISTEKISDLISLCHPTTLMQLPMQFNTFPASEAMFLQIQCTSLTQTAGSTRVDSAAPTSVQIATLAVYEVCKTADRDKALANVCVLEKHAKNSSPYATA